MVCKLPGLACIDRHSGPRSVDRRDGVGSAGASLVVGLGLLVGACGGVSPDPSRAKEDLPPVEEIRPETARAVSEANQLAANQLALGDVDAAQATVEGALGRNPRDPMARALLGAALMQRALQERPPELHAWRTAESELARAEALAPDHPGVACLQGKFYAADGHLSAAASAAERGLAGHPDHVECLQLAAAWRYELGEERAARVHLERLLPLTPDDPMVLYRLGMCRMVLVGQTQGMAKADPAADLGAAVDLFGRYLDAVDDDPHGYLAAANAAYRAAEAVPADDPSREGLLGRAREWTAAGRERFPRRPELGFLGGLVAEAQGDIEGAMDAYGAALRVDPGHSGSGLNLSALHFAREENEPARRILQRLLESDPIRSDLSEAERRAIRAKLSEVADG